MNHFLTIQKTLQSPLRCNGKSSLPTIDGLIIAGGAASRLAGHNKALLTWRGAPLISWVSEALRPQVRQLLINANRDLEQLRSFCDALWPDTESGYPGPLAGLAVAAQHSSADYLVCVPCDTPYLPPDLVDRLQEATNQARSAHVFDGTRTQPLCCLLSRQALTAVKAHRANANASMHSFLQSIGSVSVDFSDRAAGFFNVNDPVAWEAQTPPPPWSRRGG